MTAYAKGYQAFVNNESLSNNPFPHIEVDEETDHRQWCAGWYDAQNDRDII